MPFQKHQLPEEEETAGEEKVLEEEEDPRKFKCRQQISLGLWAGEGRAGQTERQRIRAGNEGGRPGSFFFALLRHVSP